MSPKFSSVGPVISVFALCFSAVAADITGTWEVTVKNPRGTFTTPFVFTQAGSKISGYGTSPQGSREEIISGRVDNGRIEFTVRRVNPSGEAAPVIYKGAVTGDEMKGTYKGPGGNDIGWTAKRVKPRGSQKP
ncbi:MAG: hypothetical protein HY651_10655 [Acidobacteria bacterium]|nr:hypothetical protein [Acidobacteriota bacterium]